MKVLAAIAFLFLSVTTRCAEPASLRVLDARQYYLSAAGSPEWEEFASRVPNGRQLDLNFQAIANETEQTLFIRQRDVKQTWDVRVNGRQVGHLEWMEQAVILVVPIPAGVLKDGRNVLSILPPTEPDDVLVGEFKLDPRPLSEALAQAVLNIQVVDKSSGSGIPCRITVTDMQNALVPFAFNGGPKLAARTGVAYPAEGHARVGVEPGDYIVYASRGFEYGVATQRVSVARGEVREVGLQIAREVPTPGLVSCDTHIHTLTYSGHGDATMDERMLTIAGEGIELAVATDHNHNTDYSEAAVRMKLNQHFSSVVGNEITTKAGHFNAFPVKPGKRLPNDKLTNWVELLADIHAMTGAKVVSLNHPRDAHDGFMPFGTNHFNTVTGEMLSAPNFDCNAVEVITSSALQSDIMLLYRDWFALLNYGRRISAIASSDAHDVSRYILGQARTYVACDDRDPAKINIDEVCDSFVQGRVSVSLGLLVQIVVNERYGMGDLAKGLEKEIRVSVQVLGPSWTSADRVELYANGVKIRETNVVLTSAIEKASVTWTIPRPPHDVHLVAIASGPGVTAPYCEIPRPYNPVSKVYNPRVLGSTSPVWIDGDDDGKFTASRQYAEAVLKRTGGNVAKLIVSLAAYDETVAVQAASLCRKHGIDLSSPAFVKALGSASPAVKSGFNRWAQ